MIMDRKTSDETIDKKDKHQNEIKPRKHVRMPNDLKSNKHHRSTSNNRPGLNKEKYKQNDTSGPITAKNSKLPDAFLDINYKGKRSMKQISKPEKHHEVAYYKSTRNNEPGQPSKSSHGKSGKINKDNANTNVSPHEKDEEETKGTDDDYKHGVKNKPKIITGKLPLAFSNPQSKYKSNKSEQYIKQMKDAGRGDESRKNKQTTLDPIPIAIERQNKMKRALNDGSTKADSNIKYDHMAASKSNGFGSFKKISSDVQMNAISPTDIKLQQMVSLSLIKSSSLSGPIKKMLHVPTFSIYCVKEIPISSRESNSQLKKWIIEWETALQKTDGEKHLVTIHGAHWNSPEGWVSVVMEYLNGGSLLNLLESVGALPENILLEITHSLLHSLNFMHNKAKVSHNGLTMSQIMFDRDGKIKLNLGISQIFPKEDSYKSSLGPAKMGLYSAHEINSPARIKKMSLFNDSSTNENTEASDKYNKEIFAQDIFDLGYMLLISAIGGLDLINHEALDVNDYKDTWWLLHLCEKIEGSANNISITDLLKDRYSPTFSDFLCKWLKFDYKERESIKNFLGKDGHPWLNQRNLEKPEKGLNITIKELLNISGGWTDIKQWTTLYLDEFKSTQLDKLLDFIVWVEDRPSNISKSKIKKIADELGIEFEVLQKQLKEINYYN